MVRLIRRMIGVGLLIASGCGSATDRPSPDAGPTAAPPTSSAAPSPSLPAGSRAAIRDATARSPFVSGIGLEARALLGKVAVDDGLPLALRFVRETQGSGPDPWDVATLDGAATLAGLRFEIELPGGAKRTLELAPDADAKPSPISPTWWTPTVTLEKAGLRQRDALRPWKTPADDAFAATGAVAVTVSATFRTNGEPIALTTSKLVFDVASPTDAFRRLVDLERAASSAAKAAWNADGIPIPRDPTVEDVEGNLVVRFERDDGPLRTAYEKHLLEVWIDRSGKVLALDPYEHFTCVAEGTRIATPSGEVPIETLTVGAEVLAYDVATQRRAVAKIVRMDRDVSDALVRLGNLVVTEHHPVWSDGRWVEASDVAAGATLLGDDLTAVAAAPAPIHAAHVVYDLTVTEPHTYFAGGVLVHNKAVGVPLGGAGRPWGALFFRHAAK